jgi:hypothetical protein
MFFLAEITKIIPIAIGMIFEFCFFWFIQVRIKALKEMK